MAEIDFVWTTGEPGSKPKLAESSTLPTIVWAANRSRQIKYTLATVASEAILRVGGPLLKEVARSAEIIKIVPNSTSIADTFCALASIYIFGATFLVIRDIILASKVESYVGIKPHPFQY